MQSVEVFLFVLQGGSPVWLRRLRRFMLYCPYRRKILLPVLTLLLLIPSCTRNLDDAEKLKQKVIELSDAGKYSEAIPFAEKELAIKEKVLGSNHIDIAQSVDKMAALHFVLGDFAEAEAFLKRSEEIKKKNLIKSIS